MKEIEPQFDSELVFVAVDVGYGRDLKDLHVFVWQEGYPWSVEVVGREVLLGLDVKVQSTKIAIDADGRVIYRAGYGEGTNEEWLSIFKKSTGEISK